MGHITSFDAMSYHKLNHHKYFLRRAIRFTQDRKSKIKLMCYNYKVDIKRDYSLTIIIR